LQIIAYEVWICLILKKVCIIIYQIIAE
jgi:hypothetical protein